MTRKAVSDIVLEGVYYPEVLGTFRVIRGFADLRELAEISVPFKMSSTNGGGLVEGHQRQLDESHAEDIRHYFERSSTRFIPEIILAVRIKHLDIEDESRRTVGIRGSGKGLRLSRRFKNSRVHKLIISVSQLEAIRERALIRRIDGNHRLALASELESDRLPSKYIAPFCLIVLGPADSSPEDDYAESVIFHTVNSTALPLDSEHALRLILGQRPDFAESADQEFANSPELYLTRKLRDKIAGLPRRMQRRLGEKPLTVLAHTAEILLDLKPGLKRSRRNTERYASELYNVITEALSRLGASHPELCQSSYFIELLALVCEQCRAKGAKAKDLADATIEYMARMGDWLGRDGWGRIQTETALPKQIVDIFEAVCQRIPRRVFLARWYPPAGEAIPHRKAKNRLRQIRRTLTDVEKETGRKLELVDMGTRRGGTEPIHPRMYEAIKSSDIILIDLTGHRPNVYVEAGYALRHHNENRLIFLFSPKSGKDKVPFDLNTFRYRQISEAADIPGEIGPDIKAILKEAGAEWEGQEQ